MLYVVVWQGLYAEYQLKFFACEAAGDIMELFFTHTKLLLTFPLPAI